MRQLTALLFFISVYMFAWTPHAPAGGLTSAPGPIWDGPELDYQPSILRIEPEGDLMIIFERIKLPSFFGDFHLSVSTDDGQSWTVPVPVIDSPKNERHPSLVRLTDGSFALFYLVDETGAGSYRIHRATSSDGYAWTDEGILDLGWTDSGEINPCVIVEEDGSLTMTYHRLSGPGYIARSTDDGATWDTWKTQVSEANAQLPRLTKRETDGLYVVTYQVGSSNLDIYSKTSTDPYDWSGPQHPVSTTYNSHDSQPIALPGGMFLVTYAQVIGSVFEVFFRTSADGEEWSEAVRVTDDLDHYDTQPHPIRSHTPGSVILSWSHQKSDEPYEDHDVWVDDGLPVPLPLWLDSDTISSGQGGTVQFTIDAGPAYAGRAYFLVGGISGTDPGTPLPGGGTLPVNRDFVTDHIVENANNEVFADFRGTLDGNGTATAVLEAGGPIPLAEGHVIHFAFTTLFPFDFQSNPVAVSVSE